MGNKTVGELKSTDQVIDPSTGTILTNDLSVENAKIIANNGNIEIKGGSFIQTNSDNVFNYSAKNTFIQAESTDDYGPAYTGSMGFCILSVNSDLKLLKLSGDLTNLEEFYKSHKDTKYSILLGSSVAEPYCTKVTNISGQYVTIDNFPNSLYDETTTSEDKLIEWFLSDDNAFYAPEYPTVGNQGIPCLYGGHAEGGSTKAIGKYTHAEGRASIADMRYSHAEGDQNKALGIGSKAEGKLNTALGKYSHVDGYEAQASDDYAYVWRGRYGTSNYNSNGRSTFNISPEGDTKGFYIGKKSLQTYLDEIPRYGKALDGKKFFLKTIGDI